MSDCKCDVLCDDILPSLVRFRSRLSCRFPKGEGWMKCLLCEDTGWVCENHPDQPWQGPCGGAGAPCPRCNAATADEPPRLPKGFEPNGE